MKKMNSNESKVVHIVESILPTIESEDSCVETEIITKSEPETIIFQTLDENGFIHTTQSGSLISQIKSGISQKCYPVYGDAVSTGKQYSSTTIVGAGDATQQNETDVTTIHVLGLNEEGSNMEVAYENAIQLPIAMETLEVPVEAMLSANDEIQSIHIGDYATIVNPTSGAVQEQPVLIASTDSQGNCFVTVQEDQIVSSSASGWSNSNKRKSQEQEQITVTRVVQPRHPIGLRGITRYGRCRMIADRQTSIPVAEFKAQLNDTSDIIGTLDLAPTTKKKMNYLSSKGFGKLFSSPGRKMVSPEHIRLFTRHLVLTRQPVEETFDDMVLLPLGYQPEVDPTKIKRITRRRRYPEAEEYQRRLIQEQMQQTFDNLVAESQKSMEAVFLENTGSVKEEEDQGNLQILVQAAENDSLEHEGRGTQPDIGIKTATPNQEDSCTEEQAEHQSGDWLGTVQQYIIIVPIDPHVDTTTETVITS